MIIGSQVKELIFNNKAALGEGILINNHLYTVVGTIERGSVFS